MAKYICNLIEPQLGSLSLARLQISSWQWISTIFEGMGKISRWYIHCLEWRIKSAGLFFCQFNYKHRRLSLPLKERSMQSYHFWIYCLQDCLTDWSQRFFAKKHILKGMMPIGDPMYKKTANLLIHQVHLFCNLKEDLLCELELLRDVFISNGKLS